MLTQIKTFKEFLLETIQFSKRADYGQIVILSGGSGSGKGFVKDWFLDVAGYKSRDVDEFKTKFLKNIQRKSKNNHQLGSEEQEILNHLNDCDNDIKKFLNNSANVSLIHMYVQSRLDKKLSETDYKIKDKIKELIDPIIQKHLKYEDELEYLDTKIFPELKIWIYDLLKEIYITTFNDRPTSSDISRTIYLSLFPKFEEKIKSIKDVKILKTEIIEEIKKLVKSILDNENSYPKDLLLIHKAASVTTKENLPNLLFDITFQDTWYLENIIPKFIETGYDPKNIHMVWILTDLELAEDRNSKRERVVPVSVTHPIHAGVIKSMLSVLTNKENLIPKYLNGDIYIVNNIDMNIPEEGVERTQGNITQQYTDSKNKKKYIVKSEDMQKVKIKNAGSPRIDLSKLNTFDISTIIKKNIERLDNYSKDEEFSKNLKKKNMLERFQTTVNHSKEVMDKIK